MRKTFAMTALLLVVAVFATGCPVSVSGVPTSSVALRTTYPPGTSLTVICVAFTESGLLDTPVLGSFIGAGFYVESDVLLPWDLGQTIQEAYAKGWQVASIFEQNSEFIVLCFERPA